MSQLKFITCIEYSLVKCHYICVNVSNIFFSYCDCFANGEFCHNCNCTNCYNNLDHEEDRQRAIKACLDRNPLAFHPKIGKYLQLFSQLFTSVFFISDALF